MYMYLLEVKQDDDEEEDKEEDRYEGEVEVEVKGGMEEVIKRGGS